MTGKGEPWFEALWKCRGCGRVLAAVLADERGTFLLSPGGVEVRRAVLRCECGATCNFVSVAAAHLTPAVEATASPLQPDGWRGEAAPRERERKGR